MACYFHMRAIFLRAASKETRGKQESVRGKTKLFFQKHEVSQHAAVCSGLVVCGAGSHLVIVWVKRHLRWRARRVVSNTINT